MTVKTTVTKPVPRNTVLLTFYLSQITVKKTHWGFSSLIEMFLNHQISIFSEWFMKEKYLYINNSEVFIYKYVCVYTCTHTHTYYTLLQFWWMHLFNYTLCNDPFSKWIFNNCSELISDAIIYRMIQTEVCCRLAVQEMLLCCVLKRAF